MKNDSEQTTDEDDEEGTDESGSGMESEETNDGEGKDEGVQVKVPEQFQKEAMALVQSCSSIACLDFLQSEVSEMRSKMMSTEKKSGLNKNSFSDVDMPSE